MGCRNVVRLLILFGLGIVMSLLCLHPATAMQDIDDSAVIRQVAYQHILQENPEAEDIIFVDDAVTILDGYGLVGWGLSGMRGVTVTKRQNNSWTVVCSTRGAYTSEEMTQFCQIPVDTAQTLYQQWTLYQEQRPSPGSFPGQFPGQFPGSSPGRSPQSDEVSD